MIIDTGCADFEQAAYNRYIIANKLFTTGYILAENAIKRTPLNCPLPSWIPKGQLPYIGKKEWGQFSGEQGGGYEIIEPEVVGA